MSADGIVGARWRLAAGSTALITGASQGIGLACAEELLALGCHKVFLVARTPEQVDAAVARLCDLYGQGRAAGIALDLGDPSSVAAVVGAVESQLGGRLDILINNVGTNTRKKIEETTEHEYDSMLSLNVRCTFSLCRALAKPLWDSKACVVNVASVAGIRSSGTGTIYALTKGAIVQFTRALACEWARRGVRVNCVCPWMTYTPLLRDAVAKDPSAVDLASSATPMQRLAEPHEQAACVAFLCLPASSYVTGQVIACDGGISAQGFAGPCTQL